jgi:hypothetical protein
MATDMFCIHHLRRAADLLPGRPLRRQAVAWRAVVRRFVAAVYAFADGFGPRECLIA